MIARRHPGGAYAGGCYTDPGVRYKRAIGQGTHALLGVLSAPGGDAPDGQHRRALRQSARALATAKADLDAEMSLTFTGYGPLSSRSDPATRAEAARLARKLGFDQYGPPGATTAWPPRGRGGGAASLPGVGTPPWRFGMGESPYLDRHLSAGSDIGRYNASNPGGPGYTAPMAPPHMVRKGYYRPRPELASPTPSGRIAPDAGGGRWYNASRDGGARLHNGIDFEAAPGTPLVSTVDGVVTKVGQPYGEVLNAGEPTYRFVEVTTADGYVTRLLYVDPSVKVGDRVRAGKSRIGVAQDITLRYADNPYHVHFEMRNSGKPLPAMDQIMGRTHEQSKFEYKVMSPRVDPTNLFSWPWPFEVRRPPP